MTRKTISVLLLAMLTVFVAAQSEPKHEIRSTWIASVANIDWPKYEHRGNMAAQQEDLILMLEEFKATNMNAVFLQVRPECDALYVSAYEPWSRYLTWSQGTDPGYDPLQFAIQEGHKRGIEVHAWINPYRINASSNDGGNYYHPDHVYIEHPEWALVYASGRKILNPGLPEVMSYIGDVIRDLVAGYQLDGVHFDDYFYSYDGTPASLDAAEYATYGDGMTLHDWRRDNVNRMVDTVYKAIQETNPNVRFGVSPFGIYKNGVPPGIIGFDAYSTIYCDPLAWLRDGTVDYLTPQLYWPTGGAQDFETLVNWWSDTLSHYGRHLYPGMGTYRLGASPGEKGVPGIEPGLHEYKEYFNLSQDTEKDQLSLMEQSLLKGTGDPVASWTLGQIGLQIDLIRANAEKNGLGSVFFSAKDIRRVSGLQAYLKQNKFTHKTLVPEMTWKIAEEPGIPGNLRTGIKNDEYYLFWDLEQGPNDRFAIYATSGDIPPAQIIIDPSNLQAVTFEKEIALAELVISEDAFIVITAISATGKEGLPSTAYTLGTDIPFVTLVSPADSIVTGTDDQLTWRSDFTDPIYQLQIATNSSFSNVVYTSAWISDTTFSLHAVSLDGETDHYWRVRANNGATGPYSGARIFHTGFPETPELVSPGNLDQQVSTIPRISWNATAQTEMIRIQVAEQSSFATLVTEEYLDAAPGDGKLSYELEKENWYYLRISGTNQYGTSEFSDFVTFKTTSGEIPEVSLVVPGQSSIVASFDHLQWETNATTGNVTYHLQVALDDGFNTVMFNSGWIGEQTIELSELQLEGQRTYYWRVKAKSEFGEGSYSQVRIFETGYPTRPEITHPIHLSEGNSIWTGISWNADETTDSIYVEISDGGFFETLKHSERLDAALSSQSISVSLEPFTWYFLRIRAENEYGGGVFSGVKYFKTDQDTYLEPGRITGNDFTIFPTFIRNGELNIRFNKPGLVIHKVEIIESSGRIIFENSEICREDFNIYINESAKHSSQTFFLKINYNKGQATIPFIFIK